MHETSQRILQRPSRSKGAHDGYLNDVWRSTDGGVSWIQLTPAAAFAPRFGRCAVTLANKLCVIGGYDGNAARAVYESVDGTVWKQVGTIPNPYRTTPAYSGCTAHNGKIIVTDGTTFVDEGGQGVRLRPAGGVEGACAQTVLAELASNSTDSNERNDGQLADVWSARRCRRSCGRPASY